jgi:hypothetical protein
VDNTPLKNKSVRLGDLEYSLNFEDEAGRINARRTIYKYFRDIIYTDKLEQFKSLSSSLEVKLPELPTEEYAPLSWNEIREMSKNNIEFGAHTCTHEILSKIGNDDAYYEISQSKKRIEDELQLEVNTFAYPNGQNGDFTEETKMLLKKTGYKLAFTTVYGMNNKFTDIFLHNRILASSKYKDYFLANLSGLNLIKGKIRNVSLKPLKIKQLPV